MSTIIGSEIRVLSEERNEIDNNEREFYNNRIKKYSDAYYIFVHSRYTLNLIKKYGFIQIGLIIQDIENSESFLVPLAEMALDQGILKNKEDINWANYLIASYSNIES